MPWPLSILTKTLLIKRLICGQTGKKVAIITRDKNCSCDQKFSFSGCVKPSLSLSEEIGDLDKVQIFCIFLSGKEKCKIFGFFQEVIVTEGKNRLYINDHFLRITRSTEFEATFLKPSCLL